MRKTKKGLKVRQDFIAKKKIWIDNNVVGVESKISGKGDRNGCALNINMPKISGMKCLELLELEEGTFIGLAFEPKSRTRDIVKKLVEDEFKIKPEKNLKNPRYSFNQNDYIGICKFLRRWTIKIN